MPIPLRIIKRSAHLVQEKFQCRMRLDKKDMSQPPASMPPAIRIYLGTAASTGTFDISVFTRRSICFSTSLPTIRYASYTTDRTIIMPERVDEKSRENMTRLLFLEL